MDPEHARLHIDSGDALSKFGSNCFEHEQFGPFTAATFIFISLHVVKHESGSTG
jgi:hypothetical protein